MSLTLTLGSIHAFSVFTTTFELKFDSSRASVSSIYSLALVCLTAAVFVGHRVYATLSPAWLSAVVCLCAATGLAISALAENWWHLLFGYSILFGGANGIGYGYSLQLAAICMPQRKGFAMGLVTAIYAVGATASAALFTDWINTSGMTGALFRGAVVMCVVAGFSAALLTLARCRYHLRDTTTASPQLPSHIVLLLWAGYGLGAAAGLMAIGHAFGITAEANANSRQIVLGVMLIGIGNAIGGVAAGMLSDRMSPLLMVALIPILAALSILTLAFATTVHVTLLALALCGFAYGALIAVYPVAVDKLFGTERAAKAYGRIFTAWGLAGLTAPWLAGYLYDWHGNYQIALWVALVAAIISSGCAAIAQRLH